MPAVRSGNLSLVTTPPPVTVYPPDAEGGRLVRIHGVVAGRAYGLWDMVVFLHRTALSPILLDEDEIADSDLIEWRGGGPDVWEP